MNEFFENRKPWSERKHRLLLKYLPPFSAKVATTTRNRKIFVVDGFAGAARYDDGSKGSPVLIAEFSDVCAGWSNPVSLHLINIEPDKKNEGIFSSLELATTQWVSKGNVVNIRKDFRSALPEVLQLISEAPSLFFVDPFGPTYVHFNDLRPILERPQRITELIVNFDQDGLRRILDAALSENTNPKAAQTNSNNISMVVGTTGWKKKIIGANLSSDEAEDILVSEYMDNIARFGYAVVAYPIREALTSGTKYHFVYCTRHSDGIALMNDFIREEEDLLYGDHVEDRIPLFSNEASLSNAIASRRRRLRGQVEKYVSEKQTVTREQIRTDLIRENFGDFHGKDFTAVVKELLESGVLRTASGKTRINDTELLSTKNFPK